MCFTRVGSSPTSKHQTRLKRLAKDKHSSLLRTFVNYVRKKFCNIGPSVIKLFVRNLPIFVISQCLLDSAGKACQVQALQLITQILKLRTKKFYNIGPWSPHKNCNGKKRKIFKIEIRRTKHQQSQNFSSLVGTIKPFTLVNYFPLQ